MKAMDKAIANQNTMIGDMDIVSDMFKDHALIIPHRPYNLLTGEFRNREHTNYLGVGDDEEKEKWNSDAIFTEAKYVHFSDWPYPKPWIEPLNRIPTERPPKCEPDDCRDQEVWLGLHKDFKERMQASPVLVAPCLYV
jgi:hypothetical protein